MIRINNNELRLHFETKTRVVATTRAGPEKSIDTRKMEWK